MAVLLATICAVFWGASDFAGGLATQRDDPYTVTTSREALEALVVAILAIVVVGHPSVQDLLLGAGGGVIGAVGLPVFYRALSTGRMSVIAPVTGTVGAVFPVVAGLVDGERPSTLQIVGIVVAVVGIALISVVTGENTVSTRRTLEFAEDIGIATFCGIAFGSFFVLIHHTSDASGLWPNVMVSSTMVVLLGIFGLFTHKRFVVKRSSVPLNIVGASLDVVAFVSFTYATRRGLLSITGIVASLYPVITALLAVVILKERFSSAHKAGLILSMIALGLIAS